MQLDPNTHREYIYRCVTWRYSSHIHGHTKERPPKFSFGLLKWLYDNGNVSAGGTSERSNLYTSHSSPARGPGLDRSQIRTRLYPSFKHQSSKEQCRDLRGFVKLGAEATWWRRRPSEDRWKRSFMICLRDFLDHKEAHGSRPVLQVSTNGLHLPYQQNLYCVYAHNGHRSTHRLLHISVHIFHQKICE